jgi:hypothetical protein
VSVPVLPAAERKRCTVESQEPSRVMTAAG